MATLSQSAPPVMRSPGPLAPGQMRLDSVDILRGLVMVIMALDHTREYLTYIPFAPEFFPLSWPSLWFTRWITHFCAPVFVFLAGTGAYLSYARHGNIARTSRLLWTRGLWLVVVEFTFVGYAWVFLAPFGFGQVIWAIGMAMIVNALLIRLPLRWLAVFGGVMVAGHNLLDGIQRQSFGRFAWLWTILHQPGLAPLPAWAAAYLPQGTPPGIIFVYPLIPWIGVMSLGFCFGAVLRRAPADRQRWMLRAGALASAAFLVLRVFNLYGNPPRLFAAGPFVPTFHWQPTLGRTFMLLTDVEKYPPSLQFLLMTLGPALIALALFDRIRLDGRGVLGAAGRFFVVYGRVPMFYYVLHLYLVHLSAYFIALATHQPAAWLLHGAIFFNRTPAGYGHHLPFIYLVWAVIVLLLYYPCRWFMGVKQRRRDWWLSYI